MGPGAIVEEDLQLGAELGPHSLLTVVSRKKFKDYEDARKNSVKKKINRIKLQFASSMISRFGLSSYLPLSKQKNRLSRPSR